MRGVTAAPHLGALAHALAEPVVLARSHARLLAEHDDRPATAEHLRALERATRQLEVLLHGIARLQRAAAAPAPAPTDLEPAVERAREHVARRHDGAPGLELRRAAPLPAVLADADLLVLLLEELLDNAISHAEFGEVAVDVRAVRDGGDIVLELSDDGPGLPGPADAAFEPFRRLGPRARRAHAGVGLAVCRAIAEAHGAGITLRPAAGGGTTVAVRFPEAP